MMNYKYIIKIIAKLAPIGDIIKKFDDYLRNWCLNRNYKTLFAYYLFGCAGYLTQRSISLNETLRPYIRIPVRYMRAASQVNSMAVAYNNKMLTIISHTGTS